METDADKNDTEESVTNKELIKSLETEENTEKSQSKEKENEGNGEPLISSSSMGEVVDKETEQDPLSDERIVVEDVEKPQEQHNKSLNMIDESMYPKDEDEDTASNSPLNNVMVVVNDHDPMDLLEPLNRGNPRTEDDSDDDSGSGNTERMTKEELWKLWMTKYEWLLHEPSQGDFAYCLYCDVTTHIVSVKYIKQHVLSLYHQEREDNYLAFRESEEKLHGETTLMEIKQEFGTDSRIAALKLQRTAHAESLNNFNWGRWMKSHPWLVREEDEGTIGYCKYCKTRLNIEFTYLRKRHETSKGHREAERTYKKRESKKAGQEPSEQSRKRKRSEDEDDDDDETGQESNEDEDDDQDDEDSDDDDVMLFYETIPNSNPPLANCTLCEIKLTKNNFRRHTRTKSHIQNLDTYKAKNKTIKKEVVNMSFSKYAKQHPWLTSDPNDPDCGYCTVCDKRFMYGHSAVKRKLHENSATHKTAAGLPVNDEEEDDESDSEESVNQESDKMSDNDDASSNLEDEEEMEEEQPSKQKVASTGRVSRGSEQWFANKDYPWCKPHRSDPSYMMCIYCNISLTLTCKRKVHSATRKHKTAELEWRKKHKHTKKSAYYPWLCYTRNKKIQFCKYCRVRFPNEKSKARHEHSQRHKESLKKHSRKIQQSRESRSQNNDSDHASNESRVVEPVASTPPKDGTEGLPQREKVIRNNIYANVTQWKSRFPWLSYKRNELRVNYGWCKICEASFFVPSYKYASKHQRSGRHIRARVELKRSNEAKDSTSQTNVTTIEKNKESLADVQEKYPWLDLEKDENYCRCRICDIRLPMKVLYRRQHNTSKRHLEQVRLLAESTTSKTVANEAATTDIETIQVEDEDVSILEDNALNEVVSIKSESGDDAVELFIESTQNETLSENIEPPTKRAKLSAGVTRNPVVDARQRMLQTVRQLSSKRRHEDSPLALAEGIISSSLSIAACFAPLMQQAPNQTETTNASQTPKPTSNSNQSFDDIPTSTQSKRDTTDLFFESVSETMKSLPNDLVAEGKMKIMQVMYELELRAIQRLSDKSDPQTNKESRPTVNKEADTATNGRSTVATPTANGNDVISKSTATVLESSPLSTQSTTSVNEENNDGTIQVEDDIVYLSSQSSKDTVQDVSNVVSDPNKRNEMPRQNVIQSTQIHSMPKTNGSTTAVINKTNNSDFMTATNRVNNAPIKRVSLPPSLQTNTRVEAGTVRCVPLNTLTSLSKGAEQIVGTKHSTPIHRNPQPSVRMGEHNMTTNNGTTTMSNSGSAGFRQIRVNTSTQSKYITIKSGNTTDPPIRMNNSMSGMPNMRLNNNPMQVRHLSK